MKKDRLKAELPNGGIGEEETAWRAEAMAGEDARAPRDRAEAGER
jgi:hypothetical protein